MLSIQKTTNFSSVTRTAEIKLTHSINLQIFCWTHAEFVIRLFQALLQITNLEEQNLMLWWKT